MMNKFIIFPISLSRKIPTCDVGALGASPKSEVMGSKAYKIMTII